AFARFDGHPELESEGIVQDILPVGGYLTAGVAYYAEMFVSLAETSGIATTMGFILSDGATPYFSYYNPTAITDKTNWTRISTCFTATGHEDKLTVTERGSGVTAVAVTPATGYDASGYGPSNFAYYYIDDVSIRPLANAGDDKTVCSLS